MNSTLAQQHLNIGFVRLRIQIVDQKYGKIDLLAYNHRRDLRVTAHRSRVHALDIALNPIVSIRFLDQRSRRSRAHELVMQ